jgi:hypothetical protein
MILTKTEIQKIASEIVGDSISSGKPVQECVVVKIKGMDVNPEQIKRIVENVNVNSFLKRYEGANADEKDDAIDFDLVNPETVAKDNVKESAQMHMQKEASYEELWDYFGPPPGNMDDMVKVADCGEEHDEEKKEEKKEPSVKEKNAMFGYLKRAIQEMDQKIANAELDYLDGYNALKDECSGIYFNMTNFCNCQYVPRWH